MRSEKRESSRETRILIGLFRECIEYREEAAAGSGRSLLGVSQMAFSFQTEFPYPGPGAFHVPIVPTKRIRTQCRGRAGSRLNLTEQIAQTRHVPLIHL